MKKNTLIIGALFVIGIASVVYFIYNKKNSLKNEVDELDDNRLLEPEKEMPILSDPSNLLDGNKLLKIGVKGAETKELQRLLGIVQDGVFGNQTQTTLFNKKGLKEITLNNWITTPNTANPNIIYKYNCIFFTFCILFFISNNNFLMFFMHFCFNIYNILNNI